VVNRDLNEKLSGSSICVSSATARELLVISHGNVTERRFLAIGFFEIDSRGRRLINIGRPPCSDPLKLGSDEWARGLFEGQYE
jgi:hypothetical protein